MGINSENVRAVLSAKTEQPADTTTIARSDR